MKVRPKLRAERSRPIVETPVHPVVFGDRTVKIMRPAGVLQFVCLLALITGAGEVMVQQAGKELVAEKLISRRLWSEA